ncbi:MAG TPA: hypothetical protein VGE99_07065 [Candidatus Dormibacteraeota bacterium]
MSEAPLADSRAARFMTWFALVFSLATATAYLLLVLGQGGAPSDIFTVVFVASYLAALAALLAASLLRRWSVAVRLSLRAAAAGGLLVLGVLAIFSIGLPLLIAGAMATGATVRTQRGPFLAKSSISAVGAAAVAVLVLVAGFEATERVIVCPAHGSSGGGGSGLVTGPYYYDCVEGKLSFHYGSCGSTSKDSNGVTHPGC